MNNLYEINETQLQIIRRVMATRIEKGYNAALLSSLIGKPYNYIAKVEGFTRRCYPISVLRRIARALELADYTCFLPGKITTEKTRAGKMRAGKMAKSKSDDKLKVRMEKDLSNGIYIYTCASFTEGNKKKVQFVLEEPVDLSEDLAPGIISEYDLVIIVDMIYVMIRDGFFDMPKVHLDVYLYINEFLKFRVNPDCVQFLLDEYCYDSRAYRLLLVRSGGFVSYLKDFT